MELPSLRFFDIGLLVRSINENLAGNEERVILEYHPARKQIMRGRSYNPQRLSGYTFIRPHEIAAAHPISPNEKVGHITIETGYYDGALAPLNDYEAIELRFMKRLKLKSGKEIPKCELVHIIVGKEGKVTFEPKRLDVTSRICGLWISNTNLGSIVPPEWYKK